MTTTFAAASPFRLRAYLTDGFAVDLDERYTEQWRAERAAENYSRDYSDPCGLGVKVASVAIIDTRIEEGARA